MKDHYEPLAKGELPETVSNLLQQASARQTVGGVDPERFVEDVRARIERELASGRIDAERLIGQEVTAGQSAMARRRIRGWVVAASAAAAAVLLFASFGRLNSSAETRVDPIANRAADELAGQAGFWSKDEGPEADARVGVQWVNRGLIQTVQSVGSARKALRDLIGPLKETHSEFAAGQPKKKDVVGPLDFSDERFVSTLTQRVLGHPN